MKFHMWKMKLKGKTDVYCQSDGSQNVAILYSQWNFTDSHFSYLNISLRVMLLFVETWWMVRRWHSNSVRSLHTLARMKQ